MIGAIVCTALACLNVYGIVLHGQFWPLNLVAFGICSACAGFCFALDLRRT